MRQELLQSVNEGPPQPISGKTMRWELHAMIIWRRVSRRKPSIRKSHKAVRLQCQKTPNVESGWLTKCNVVWKNRFLPLFKWRTYPMHQRLNRAFHPENLQGQTQATRWSVMFWTYFSYYGLSPLNEVTTNKNQYVYFNILEDKVLPSSQHFHD